MIYSLHFATLQHSELAKLAMQRADVKLWATVTTDAKATSHKVNGSILRTPQLSFLVRVHRVEFKNSVMKLRLPVRVLSSKDQKVIPGDKVVLVGDLLVTKEKRVAATLISSESIQVIDNAGLLSIKLAEIRQSFRKSAQELNSTAATLIPGMILGDTSLQSEEFSRQMRRSGLSHLTAVSGANFAIVSALVLWVMRYFSKRLAIQISATAIFLILFLLLVRPSPSVLRAGVMAAVILIARTSGNRRSSASALATAITLLLLLDPFQSQDPGFVLSVLATGGLIFLAPGITERLQRFMPSALAEVVAISISATVLCTPYIMFLSGEISVLSILFNILISPSVAPITISGFLAVIFLPFSQISNILLHVAEFLARWVVRISEISNLTPSWKLNPIFIIFMVLALLFLQHKSKKAFVISILIFVMLNFSNRAGFPGDDWKLVQCDVGQGDALVLNLGRGAAALFDVGPDPTLVDRCLKVLKISQLPLVVLSHNHADHTFGFLGAVRGRSVGEIWTNENVVLDLEFQKLQRVVTKGDEAQLGDFDLKILWPNRNIITEFNNLPGDGSKENNASLVVQVNSNHKTAPQLSILITGDIEPEAQSQIVRDADLSPINILKMPHHGSRFQDGAFMNVTMPEIALISVGIGNSYGHPDQGVIGQYLLNGVTVKRTDLDGPVSVAWRFDEAKKRYIFTTRSMRKEWWRIQWL